MPCCSFCLWGRPYISACSCSPAGTRSSTTRSAPCRSEFAVLAERIVPRPGRALDRPSARMEARMTGQGSGATLKTGFPAFLPFAFFFLSPLALKHYITREDLRTRLVDSRRARPGRLPRPDASRVCAALPSRDPGPFERFASPVWSSAPEEEDRRPLPRGLPRLQPRGLHPRPPGHRVLRGRAELPDHGRQPSTTTGTSTWPITTPTRTGSISTRRRTIRA